MWIEIVGWVWGLAFGIRDLDWKLDWRLRLGIGTETGNLDWD